MPHLIIEFADKLAVDNSIPKMLDAIHIATAETGLFIESHLKTRAIPVKYYRTGVGRDTFVHAQLRIKSGRNEKQKKKLSESVLSAIVKQAWPVKIVTVEVVDIDSTTYSKHIC